MATATHPAAQPLETNNNLRPFFIGCTVLLVALEVLGFFLTRDLSRSPDFRAFYAAGYLARHSPSLLFDLAAQKQAQDALISPAATSLPYYHPAYEALLFAPLSLLSFRAAYLLSIALNVLLVIAAVLLSKPLFYRSIPYLQPRPGFLFFLFAPLWLAILHGQDAVLFLLLCAFAYRLLECDRGTLAGIVLGLALFRLQLAIPLAIIIAIRKGWRFAFSFVCTGAILAALCIALTGWSGALSFVHVLLGASLSGDQSAGYQNMMGIHPLAAPNLAGLLAALGTAHLPPHTAFALAIAASAAVFVFAIYRVLRAPNLGVAFALATVASLLVSQHANPHDATILLIPTALLTAGLARYLLLAIYALAAVLLLFVGVNSFYLLVIPILALLFAPMDESAAVATS